MPLAAFHYDLPDHAIAQEPAEPRDSARLLVDGGPRGDVRHLRVADLPSLVGAGDVVVVNETRVLPARLRLRKGTGGEVEVLLLEREPSGTWRALVRPGRRVAPGTVLRPAATGSSSPAGHGDGTDLAVEVGEHLDGGQRRVRLCAADEVTALERHGTMPLPPYIHRTLHDPERYQTTYATVPGSAAAPTAGLHLTPEVLERCVANGAAVHRVDLAVGLDTFRPVTVDRVQDHVMHSERYRVPAATMAACEAADRVVAIGTTTVRALESAAATGQLEGRTDLFIHDDHPFAVVDVLLTNFHLPGSSLLVLVDAFVGPRWRALYELALAEGYRFLSFGDAMLLRRGRGPA